MDSSDLNEYMNDSSDKVNRKILSSEHEEGLKVDQMAAKKLSNEKVKEKKSLKKFEAIRI